MMRAIGLMSGTSMDGIDVALLHTDGVEVQLTGKSLTFPYTAEARAMLKRAIAAAVEMMTPGFAEKTLGKTIHQENDNPYVMLESLGQENGVIRDIISAEKTLNQMHIDAVNAFMQHFGITASNVDVIGFHGHTIAHNPAAGYTWQLGEGKVLAKALGVDVVYDFRTADVKGGGQGAPLVPLYHAALFRRHAKPVCVVNIGGVANVTYLAVDGRISAYDVGVGNAYLDDWVHKHTGETYDKDGAISAAGKVHKDSVAQWMNIPFFAKQPPKSIDRNEFTLEGLSALSLEDGAATLAYFTAAGITKALDFMPQKPAGWFITGGGRHNPTIMQHLASMLGNAMHDIDSYIIGETPINGDAIEAEAFAFLAVRTLKGLPISLPEITGVDAGIVTGGVVCER